MSEKVKVYTRTICPQCTPVKAFLKGHKIPFDMVNIDEEPEAMAYVKSRGVQSAPLLLLFDENGNEKEMAAGREAAMAVYKWNKGGLI